MGNIYRFGEFDVEPDIVQLRRARLPIHIEPKTFDLLLYLLEHRERFVGKGELLEAVWDGVFVTESAVTRAITRLRKVLGDRASRPLYIETLRGRGYRFCASVQIVVQGTGQAIEHEALRLRREARRIRKECDTLKRALAILDPSDSGA